VLDVDPVGVTNVTGFRLDSLIAAAARALAAGDLRKRKQKQRDDGSRQPDRGEAPQRSRRRGPACDKARTSARSPLLAISTKAATGHERRFRDVRERVRSTLDSGKIVTSQRTDVEGQIGSCTAANASTPDADMLAGRQPGWPALP